MDNVDAVRKLKICHTRTNKYTRQIVTYTHTMISVCNTNIIP